MAVNHKVGGSSPPSSAVRTFVNFSISLNKILTIFPDIALQFMNVLKSLHISKAGIKTPFVTLALEPMICHEV